MIARSTLHQLRNTTRAALVRNINSTSQATWYPTTISQLDSLDKTYENFVERLGTSYPGHDDSKYMFWLKDVRNHNMSVDCEVEDVLYPSETCATWSLLYKRLRELQLTYACEEHKEGLRELENLKIYGSKTIPQFSQINAYLKGKTGFKLMPVGGMINARSFLYGLAYRIFYSTRYIRHPSVPFYSPEPDVVHELMGHVPLFANKDFADLSHAIGVRSLGASDEEIDQLSKIYFYSIEFGVIKNQIVGAGILGSCNEIQHVGENKGEIQPWDISKILNMEYTLSAYQPIYYSAESLLDMKRLIMEAIDIVRPLVFERAMPSYL